MAAPRSCLWRSAAGDGADDGAAMRGLKASLLLLLAAAVAISGSLSYLLGALARTDTAAKRGVGAAQALACAVFFLSCAARDVGHNAELRSLWRAFDAAAVATQAGVQNQLNLKARTHA